MGPVLAAAGAARQGLELEQAHALQRLGWRGEAVAARARAEALAAAYGDASLSQWHQARIERQQQLLAY